MIGYLLLFEPHLFFLIVAYLNPTTQRYARKFGWL